MTHHHSGFGATFADIATRAASAIVARGRLRSEAARTMLLRRLSQGPDGPDSLLSAPIYEAARLWRPADERFGDLAGKLLRADLVDALDRAGAQALPRSTHPYTHQIEAWQSAAKARSYMVTSGTGSGKTECFMVPMLNDLLDQADQRRSTGVKAIVLYPLNALIDSQKERLSAWISPFAGRLSYAMYNRHTPDTPSPNRKPGPAEIADRRTLRQTPPDILVTNVTMLEYMLTRAQDREILAASEGKLRWIVLDEAHSYVGAQAAEMALLLRRVRQGFGVDAREVRLVATSATIGEGAKTIEELRRFVADLGGVPLSQVDIILGKEAELGLPKPKADSRLDLEDMQEATPAQLWQQLADHPRIQSARQQMRASGVTLPELAGILCPEAEAPQRTTIAEALLDAAACACDPVSSAALLPYRLHAFHRAQGGLWACVDPNCSSRDTELSAEGADWPFGQIHLFQCDRCTCGAPVFELGACSDCGTGWLMAHRTTGGAQRLEQRPSSEPDDDYILDVEPEDDGDPILGSSEVLIGPANGLHRSQPFRLADSVLPDSDTQEPGHILLTLTSAKDRACCPRAGHKTVPIVTQHFGAPFLLGSAMPLLLSGMPPAKDALDKPFGGRRLLSFTDSRQGTARFAAKLQQEAERNLTRAAIWHAVQERPEADPVKQAELESLVSLMLPQPAFAGLLAEKRRELAALTEGPAHVNWGDMVSRLSQNAELIAYAGVVWHGRPYGGNVMAENPDILARFFLLREFFRRPRMQNNAETMGFARLAFPQMETRAAAAVPEALQQAGYDVQDFISLLYAAIDLEFRGNLAVDLATGFNDGNRLVDAAHWISPKSQTKHVLEAGTASGETIGEGRVLQWPSAAQAKRRLVQLVYALTKGSPDNRADRDRAAEVLAGLWTVLRQSATIRQIGSGWQLGFAHAAVARMDTAWLCPLTRRLQPYPLAGISLNNPDAGPTLVPVSFPRLPVARATGITLAQRDVLRDWLGQESALTPLRISGIWTDLHDRAAQFAPFLRAQEHSAQIDRASLQTYEKAFREARINILNCSTTMEMGVDIPNVGVVVNTNVPPAPSNYRQRVGRAGRRAEPWALSFTFCKDQPLDWSVFRAPQGLLQAVIPAPRVSLDSPVIVQRHVNALLLSMFLRESGGIKVTTQIGTFFGATGNLETPWVSDPQADGFLVMLRNDWAVSAAVQAGLAALTEGTALQGMIGLPDRAAAAFDDVRNRWRLEYEILTDGQRSAPEGDATHNFYKYRAQRMRRDFMMTELARRGFTPSYGFPVDVVSFDHAGLDSRSSEGGPSRPLDIAIRDYAPGSEVVIDGLVHRADGILPAWGNRNDPDTVEDLRTRWSCRSCGAFGVSRAPQPNCPSCESITETREILRPSGFLGTSRPHVAYEVIAWVPPDRPRVSASAADWQTLPDPDIGRYRAERGGRVHFTASGAGSFGYAICIACGRAVAESGFASDVALPSAMAGHRPLQPVRNNPRADRLCPGNDENARKIRRNVILGHELATDVFELQLNALPVTELGRGQALAIAAALREVLARRLGVEAEAIGTAAEPGHRADGQRRMSVCLFDRASGGAGFAVAAERDVAGLLQAASQRLCCPADCAHGCPECILRKDVQYDLSIMDRRGAAKVLQTILPNLSLPVALRVFADTSRAITEPFARWFERQRVGGGLQAIDLFFHGKSSSWDLSDWPLSRLGQADIPVSIVISHDAIPAMGLSEKLDLFRLLSRSNARLFAMKSLPEAQGMPLLAQLHLNGTVQCVAGLPEAARPGGGWGMVANAPLILGTGPQIALGNPLAPMKLAQFQEGNSIYVEIGQELNGPVAQFGARFWALVRNRRSQPFVSGAALVRIDYADRYLRNPLTLRLLSEVLLHAPGRTATVKTKLLSAAQMPPRTDARLLHDNWPNDRIRLETLKAALPQAEVRLAALADCPHARQMTLEWSNGDKLILHLDQGLGAWRSSRAVPFDLTRQAEVQSRDLARAIFDVELQEGGRYPSPLWISW